MSGKIINLRQARKAKSRAEARAKGDANAARFGEAKTPKARRAAEDRLQTQRHNGHRIDQDQGGNEEKP